MKITNIPGCAVVVAALLVGSQVAASSTVFDRGAKRTSNGGHVVLATSTVKGTGVSKHASAKALSPGAVRAAHAKNSRFEQAMLSRRLASASGQAKPKPGASLPRVGSARQATVIPRSGDVVISRKGDGRAK